MSLPSTLLSEVENASLSDFFGRANQKSMSTAVCKLYVTEPGSKHREWNPLIAGVVCLIKDYNRKSYFISLFDMDQKTLAWEQEVYNEMVYKVKHTWFHTFEAESCMAGLCFADDREAMQFHEVIKLRLNKTQNRGSKRLSRQYNQPVVGVTPPTGNLPPVHEVTLARHKPQREIVLNMSSEGVVRPRNQRRQRGKINKEDISTPCDFKHVHGVKASSTGFEYVDNTDGIPEQLREFLKVAGIAESVLTNPEKRKEFNQFVQDNDVVATMEYRNSRMIQRSQRRPEVTHMTPLARQPARMETVREHHASNPPRPPPPSSAKMSRPPPPPSTTAMQSQSGSAPPPPPPPPPAPAPSSMPPAPAMPSGKPNPPAAPSGQSGQRQMGGPAPGGGRANLMDEIRKAGGTKMLQNAKDRKIPAPVEPENDGDGSLTDILKHAFTQIKEAAAFSSDDDDGVSDDSWSEESC